VDQWLRTSDDGTVRCWWGAGDDTDYVTYHDTEWGRPVDEDHRLFEKLVLEGFQSGLSWLTILRKRQNFRAAFSGFDPFLVAAFDDSDVARLMADAGIVRHRGKIEAAINNARQCVRLIEAEGSLGAYIWRHEPDRLAPEPDTRSDWSYPVASITATSTALSKDLKRRGWRFVGPTTVYAFMQATGLVNDHLPGCHARAACDDARAGFIPPA
jgi:DNA-3-methyladenine glycosylase I